MIMPCTYLATKLRLKQTWELRVTEQNVNGICPEDRGVQGDPIDGSKFADSPKNERKM